MAAAENFWWRKLNLHIHKTLLEQIRETDVADGSVGLVCSELCSHTRCSVRRPSRKKPSSASKSQDQLRNQETAAVRSLRFAEIRDGSAVKDQKNKSFSLSFV